MKTLNQYIPRKEYLTAYVKISVTHVLISILMVAFGFFSIRPVAAAVDGPLLRAVGSIPKYEGTVLLRELKDKPKKLETTDEDLHIGSTIRTRKQSQAFVKFVDGSKVVLQSNSQLSIKGIDYLQVDEGVVLFDIAKIKRKEDFKVGVKLAILGIRGTQFVVDARNDEYKVYLKQGNMFIESQNKEFEFIKDQMQDEFGKIKDTFKSEKESVQKEFAEYNKKLNKELKSFVRQIELFEDSGVSIQGNTARRVTMPDSIIQYFELLQQF